MDIGHVTIIHYEPLVRLKAYSSMFGKTFDLLTDDEIRRQVDSWAMKQIVSNGTFANRQVRLDNRFVAELVIDDWDKSHWEIREVRI